FMYQGIFDTDFDKYTEDAIALFAKTGVTTVFENLEGFPEDWKTNAPAFIKFVREHHCPSFLEYGEYPYVSAEEIKKALKLKAAFSNILDQMQCATVETSCLKPKTSNTSCWLGRPHSQDDTNFFHSVTLRAGGLGCRRLWKRCSRPQRSWLRSRRTNAG